MITTSLGVFPTEAAVMRWRNRDGTEVRDDIPGEIVIVYLSAKYQCIASGRIFR